MDNHTRHKDKCNGQLTSKAELRKVNKPLMEKRRRARINACLSQLKFLVLQAMKKQGCSYSKLEKADILEMTVQYLKTVQKNQIIAAASFDPTVANKYIAGYQECTNETVRYLSTLEGADSQMQSRLLSHLENNQEVAALPNADKPLSANRHASGAYENLAFNENMASHNMCAKQGYSYERDFSNRQIKQNLKNGNFNGCGKFNMNSMSPNSTQSISPKSISPISISPKSNSPKSFSHMSLQVSSPSTQEFSSNITQNKSSSFQYLSAVKMQLKPEPVWRPW